MFFTVVARGQVPQTAIGQAFLVRDNWDDFASFQTAFQLVVFDPDGKRFNLGDVKIGQFELQPGPVTELVPAVRAPTLENTFDALDERYFSLGQDETYYETLNELPNELRQSVMEGLRDCALDLELFERAQTELVMQKSLLRYISVENVRNRFYRLAKGDAKLTEFKFKYHFPASGDNDPPVLTFDVQPHSKPPSNIHVIIGPNGVGKTRCLHQMASAIQGVNTDVGEFRQVGGNQEDWTVAGMIFISFSAFDNLELTESENLKIRSTMVGLRKRRAELESQRLEVKIPNELIAADENQQSTICIPYELVATDANKFSTVKTPEQIATEFSGSFGKCREGLRRERWERAIKTLENDPLFAEADLKSLLTFSNEEWIEPAQELFRQLSSGHAIVLLTITRLVELVDERTLVIFDEPEGHLHPPLLSAFIRSLSDLLVQRNGVAIIATHSPVVLQEVPKSCVWMLRRVGNIVVAERPTIETFGENVGVLTREVFRLEVITAGFHNLIRKIIEEENFDYDDVLHYFHGQLGAEARAIAKGLIANRDAKK